MATDTENDLRFKLHAHANTIMRLEDELHLAKVAIEELKKDPHERRRLPDDRPSIVHHLTMTAFDGAGQLAPYDLYVVVGMYHDGRPGEVFVRAAKMGETISGFLDAWAIEASLLLQTGTTIEKICEKHRGARFQPAGHVRCGDLAFGATSLVDAIVRVLEARHVKKEEADGGESAT